MTCDGQKLPVVGRVSMDMLTIDVTALDHAPAQRCNCWASINPLTRWPDFAGTIGYEILTSLGARYNRSYIG